MTSSRSGPQTSTGWLGERAWLHHEGPQEEVGLRYDRQSKQALQSLSSCLCHLLPRDPIPTLSLPPSLSLPTPCQGLYLKNVLLSLIIITLSQSDYPEILFYGVVKVLALPQRRFLPVAGLVVRDPGTRFLI